MHSNFRSSRYRRYREAVEDEFIKGMGKHNDKFIIILDIDEVFSRDELELVEALGTDV